MRCLKISVNVSLDGVDTSSILAEATKNVANIIGKPESAYFPPISIPEGHPHTIQDAKGRDWVFQFRFWPNNNSRMYVLEGVTPCIQAMQLQAGDTVTFSRIDPEGKLVMGFRKASNSAHNAEPQLSAKGNGVCLGDGYISGVIESLPSNGSKSKEGLGLQSLGVQEKKRSLNLGSKSKRLHMDSADAMELKLTWEEAQDLLRPPPTIKPSIVMIEDHEFEEYEYVMIVLNGSVPISFGGNEQPAAYGSWSPLEA